LQNISKEQYLQSLGPESISSIISGKNFMRGITSKGKSGSFFFTCADERFFVKTIPKREFETALHTLDLYVNYLNSGFDPEAENKTFICQ